MNPSLEGETTSSEGRLGEEEGRNPNFWALVRGFKYQGKM